MFSQGWINTNPAGTTPAGGVTSNEALRGDFRNIDQAGTFPNTRITGAHATSSLARVKQEDIERSTKIISIETASHLTSYEDPIKLVLPPTIQEANVVFVTRKFAVGNTASEVPERAPAPVVSVQEETRRVRLRRYGGDIDFNVNSCAVPDMFKKEMDLKVGAQHAALADKLISLGYERLISDGTDFVTALTRSTGNALLPQPAAQRFAKNYYNSQVFGALGKQTYALQNLLAAAKRCVAYDISRAIKTVMILPHGVPELMMYSKAENMTYEINGIRGPQGKPISMTVESGYSVPATSSTVFVHIPPAKHMFNQVAPHAGKNALESEVLLVLKYETAPAAPAGGVQDLRNYTYPNLLTRRNERLGLNGDNVKAFRVLKLKMLHAILAVPGADTGNLLLQYPRSTVSADASTESGLMQLRVYMGAVLKRPENVLVMRNVAFNGIISCTDLIQNDNAAGNTINDANVQLLQGLGFEAQNAGPPAANMTVDDFLNNANNQRLATQCNGTIHDPNGNIFRSNDGPLGHLDDVAMAHRLMGAQVYDEAISAKVLEGHAQHM